MLDTLIPPTDSTYCYPLLIKNLLLAPLVNPDQEIVYADNICFDYRTLGGASAGPVVRKAGNGEKRSCSTSCASTPTRGSSRSRWCC